MQMEKNSAAVLKKERAMQAVFGLVLVLGFLARVYRIGRVPGGINQDEAYAGYEAWSLLKYGVDSNGYHFPVYLEAWGSGMNALNTYLMIPFIALFGLKNWVIRLPQLMIGILTLPAVYGIVKRCFSEKYALFAMFLCAIAPWHIMLSRWGLESNLAPGFIVFGLYFFMRGLEKPGYFILSAVMYGLSLYCYATIWPFVPLIIVMEACYCLWYRKIKKSPAILLAVLILFLLALPLLLFVAVNKGWLPEIVTPFFSVPKLAFFRSGEVSLTQILPNLKNMIYIIYHQNDGLIWNTTEKYGLYYKFSTPFFLLGVIFMGIRMGRAIKEKRFAPEGLLLIQLVAGVLLGCLIEINVNRDNIIFIPIIIITAVGIADLVELIKKPGWLALPVLIYAVAFLFFENYYYTEYEREVAPWFADGLEEALAAAKQSAEIVYVDVMVQYPRILFYEQIPVTEYLETVELYDYPGGAREVVGFGNYRFFSKLEEPDPDKTYIVDCKTEKLPTFSGDEFEIENFGTYMVAIPKK